MTLLCLLLAQPIAQARTPLSPQAMNELVEEQQAAAAAPGRIHGATRLTTHLVDGRPLIAVDVALSGGMDWDDIELVDTSSDVTVSHGPWTVLALGDDHTLLPGRSGSHLLFLYAPTTDVQEVTLRSWGHLLSERPVAVVDGDLPYGAATPMTDVKHVPWPEDRTQWGAMAHSGGWLIVRLRGAMAVVDLTAAQVDVSIWNAKITDIVTTKQGGWMAIQDGQLVEYPPGRPGAHPPVRTIEGPISLDHLANLDGTWVAWGGRHSRDRNLYRLTGDDWTAIATAEGVPSTFGRQYDHARVPLPGTLVWDSAFRGLTDNGLVDLDVAALSDAGGFMAVGVPGGFLYTDDRKLFRRSSDGTTARVAPALSNIMELHPGPEGAALLKLGDNHQGWVAAQIDLADGSVRGLHTTDLAPFLSAYSMRSLHYDQAFDRYVAITGDGLYIFPAASWKP